MRLVLFILIPLHLCFLIRGNAQEPYSIHLNQANGLPSNSVYNIYQDTKGFIWFATQEGITRYDGMEYKTYKCDEQISTAGSCIKEDKFGRVWYENFDGRLYYVWHDSLFALPQNSVFNYAPFAITQKHILIVHQYSIDVYDLKSLAFLRKIIVPSKFNFFESSYAIGNDLYFVLDDLIYRLNEKLQLSHSDFLLGRNEKIKQVYASDSFVFVVSKINVRQSIYVFDRALNNPEIIAIPEPKLIQGTTFMDGKFWIHTAAGTYTYSYPDREQKTQTTFLSGKSVSGALKDRQGNYWFSTTSEGAFLIPNIEHKLFSTKLFSPIKIVKTKEGFLLANKDASFLKFATNREFEPPFQDAKVQSELYYLYADSMSGDLIYSARGMTIYPGKKNKAARQYDVALKEITRLDNQYYAFVANGFCAIIKTPDFKEGLKSDWDSLYNTSLASEKMLFATILTNIRGRAIVFDKANNTLYCSGNKGLYKITPHSIDTLQMNGEAFYASKILSFSDKLYALNTKGNLYSIDKDKNFRLLNSLFGISNYEIRYARQFSSEMLLMSSRFVHYVDLKTMKHHIVDINIPPSAINDLFLEDSNIYVVTKDGVVRSELNLRDRKSLQTSFQINQFIVNDIPQQDFQNRNFTYKQNDVSIHFSILDFGSVQLPPLFYKLNDEDWKALSAESRNLQFKALSPGHYKIAFRLGERVLKNKLSFTIDAPFWMKWWFIMLCILFVSVIIYTYYKWQITLLSRQIKLLNEKVALEQSLGKSILTSIKSQMNPHFFYNALNTIQAYIFTNDKRNASLYLGKFSKLTRMILEMSEQEFIPLASEIQALTLYLELEKMRFDDDFEFELDVDYSVDVDMIKIPSMLIQPYAENAIKHGLMHRKGNKMLSIQMIKEGQFLKVIIDDNGIGRAKSEEMKKVKKEKHTSFSTRANEQRLAILNRNYSQKVVLEIEDKKDEHNKATGTQVRLYIPIGL